MGDHCVSPYTCTIVFWQVFYHVSSIPIEIRVTGSTRGARSRGTSWQTSADTLDVPTIIYDIYI